jgi:GNAT superfamily N-acetyltransferase
VGDDDGTWKGWTSKQTCRCVGWAIPARAGGRPFRVDCQNWVEGREVDGRPVGFVSCGACRDEDVSPEAVGEVMAIYVRPEAWGTGIGAALMREALARLRGGSSVEVALWVIEGNPRAVSFYERLGFRPDGSVRLREMFGTPTAIVRLRRRLEDSA